MKKFLIILNVLLMATLGGCQSAPLVTPSSASKTANTNTPTFAELNAQRQVNGQPPLTWDEYVEYTDPASNHLPPKDSANHP